MPTSSDIISCEESSEVLNHPGSKWTVLVVVALNDKTGRFNEIKRYVRGISHQILTRLNKNPAISYSTVSVRYINEKQHVTELLSLISKSMGIKADDNANYNLHFPDAVPDEVRAFISPWRNRKKIVINVFTATPEKNFSQNQLPTIIKLINSYSREVHCS